MKISVFLQNLAILLNFTSKLAFFSKILPFCSDYQVLVSIGVAQRPSAFMVLGQFRRVPADVFHCKVRDGDLLDCPAGPVDMEDSLDFMPLNRLQQQECSSGRSYLDNMEATLECGLDVASDYSGMLTSELVSQWSIT